MVLKPATPVKYRPIYNIFRLSANGCVSLYFNRRKAYCMFVSACNCWRAWSTCYSAAYPEINISSSLQYPINGS